MHFYIVSGILLIVPIVDFALAAPVLVQEKRQAYAGITNIPEYPITVLGKRVGDEIEEAGVKYFENYFAKPKKSSAANPPSSPPSSELDHGWVDVKHPQPPIPASSTTSDADHKSLVTHPPPPPPISALPTVPDHELTKVDAPLSSAVNPTWYLTNHGYKGPNAPQLKLGPSEQALSVEEPLSRPGSPTVTDADHGYQEVHPPSAAPSGSDFEMVDHDVPTSSGVWLTKPDRRSMGEDSRLENLQAVGDTFKGNAKESRRTFGTARDVLNVAQRELQRVRSFVPGDLKTFEYSRDQ